MVFRFEIRRFFTSSSSIGLSYITKDQKWALQFPAMVTYTVLTDSVVAMVTHSFITDPGVATVTHTFITDSGAAMVTHTFITDPGA